MTQFNRIARLFIDLAQNNNSSYRNPVFRHEDEDHRNYDEEEENGANDSRDGSHRLKRVYSTHTATLGLVNV